MRVLYGPDSVLGNDPADVRGVSCMEVPGTRGVTMGVFLSGIARKDNNLRPDPWRHEQGVCRSRRYYTATYAAFFLRGCWNIPSCLRRPLPADLCVPRFSPNHRFDCDLAPWSRSRLARLGDRAD